MTTESAVNTMARLFECRRAAKFLFSEKYDAAVAPYRDLIGRVMERDTVMPLQAALRLAQSVPEADAVPVMLFMAAAVDLIERQA